MRLNPHVTFDGQCEAAFKFYEKRLGGKIVMMMTYGDSPLSDQMPPDWRGKILHATFAWGGHILQGADAPPERYQKPQGFSIMLNIGDAAEADRIFQALADKGAVQVPVQETFWARRFGVLVDQFGMPWMINCGKPA
jgi:PhnB protein